MLLLEGDAFDQLIQGATREAFHLELQDEYDTADAADPYRRWLDGHTDDDYAWLQGWLDLIHGMTERGAAVRRARVVTEPHNRYTQWLLEISKQNAAAGEDIRYVGRDRVDPERLTADDWWLLDDTTVAFTIFRPGGLFVGGAVTTDPNIVAYCREVRDYVWSAATPLDEYTAISAR